MSDSAPPPSPETAGRPRAALRWTALAAVAAASLGLGAHAWWPRPAGHDSPPFVTFDDEGWAVRWTSARPGRGRVLVRGGPAEAWKLFDDRGDGPFHTVRFGAWPVPGENLEFRTLVGNGEPSPPRPLAVADRSDPVEVAVVSSPTSLTVTWTSATPFAGVLSLGTTGPTTREAAATQSHRVVLRGLSPGAYGVAQIESPGGQPLREVPYALPTVAAVVRELHAVLAWVHAACKQLDVSALTTRSDKVSLERQGRAWRELCLRWTSRERVKRALAWFDEVHDRVVDDPHVTAESHSSLLREIELLGDIQRFAEESFDVDPMLPYDRIGACLRRPEPPAGLVPFYAARFDDGGERAGRRAPVNAAHPVVVPAPVALVPENRGLLEPNKVRRHLALAGPLARRGPVRNVHLLVRFRDGLQIDKLVIQAGSRQHHGRSGGELAIVRGRGEGSVVEEVVRVDERRLSHAEDELEIFVETASRDPLARPVVVEWVVLLGEPCTTWPRPEE